MSMRFYGDIKRVSGDDERMVWGYASTDQQAIDGQTITIAALEDALAEYMAFANIREMHQLSAVGTAKEAQVDDKGLYLAAWVQDDEAWAKVKTGVYRGFSIGARVLSRDSADKNTITGISLYEISLVDRPADPGAVFDVFRAADSNEQDNDTMKHPKSPTPGSVHEALRGAPAPKGAHAPASKEAVARAAEATGARVEDVVSETFEDIAPQVESVAHADASEVVEADAVETPYEETQDDVSATKDPVARAVAAAEAAQAGLTKAFDQAERASKAEPKKVVLPGSEIRRGLCTVSELGWIIAELCYLTQDSALEAAIEGDNSPVPAKLRTALVALFAAYRAMSEEEMAELLKGVDVDVSLEVGIIQLAAYGADIECAAAREISSETGAKLQAAIDSVIARGFKPNVDRAVEVLTGERDTLLRTVTGLTDQMSAMIERVGKLEAQPLPPKTAGAAAVARAVDKGEDASGAPVAVSTELGDVEIKRAFDAMSDEDKALILTRAALQRPHLIKR